jgi:hypothetical protein
MAETIILMKTNLMEVSRKTGMRYEELNRLYIEALAKNNLVILTIDDRGKVTFDE